MVCPFSSSRATISPPITPSPMNPSFATCPGLLISKKALTLAEPRQPKKYPYPDALDRGAPASLCARLPDHDVRWRPGCACDDTARAPARPRRGTRLSFALAGAPRWNQSTTRSADSLQPPPAPDENQDRLR